MRRDAHGLLLRALGRWAGDGAAIGATRSIPWASATFAGARHEVTLVLGGVDAAARADRLVAGLADAEFDLRGHLVADLALAGREDGDGVRLRLEALTVETA